MRFLLPFILITLLCACEGEPNTEYMEKYPAPDPEVAIEPDSLLRHIVLFSFNPESSPQNIREIEAAFAALPAAIPEIHSFEWGLNNSEEGLDQGFTHAYLLSFKSTADRSIYLPHPDHKAFGELLKPYLADVLVVDYWAR